MPAAGDAAALGRLLRSRRECLTPAEAGLPADSFGGRYPRLGPVEYSHVVLQVGDRPDQTLVTYSHLGNM